HAHADTSVQKRWIGPLAYRHVSVTEPKIIAHKKETCANNADDDVGRTVESNGLSEDLLRASQFSLPEPLAQNHDWGGPGVIVLRSEIAPYQGCDAEDREKVRGDHLRAHALRLAGTGEIKIVGAI